MRRAILLLGALVAVGCADVNGPHCDGDLECLPFRADAASCPEFRTVPLPSTCARYGMHAAAKWLDEDGGCYSTQLNGTAPPPGFRIAGSNHWCAKPIPEHCDYLPHPCGEDQ